MAEIDVIAQDLLAQDEEDLLAQLGARSQTAAADPSSEDLSALEEPIAVPRASWNDMIELGQRVFGPASSGAYNLLCSPIGGDSALAKELDNLMNLKTAEASAKATALLTPVLTGSLGLPQSLAVVVGSLVVKKLAKGTSDFVCDNWQKNIEGATTSETGTPSDSK